MGMKLQAYWVPKEEYREYKAVLEREGGVIQLITVDDSEDLGEGYLLHVEHDEDSEYWQGFSAAMAEADDDED